MRRAVMAWLGVLVLINISCAAPTTQSQDFKFDDDSNVVVFVGGGLIEQSRLSGYIELKLLHAAPAETRVSFRNLGWSGDSVWGDARVAGYEEPAGLARLIKDTTQSKPSMIFVGYGNVESFEGEPGLKRFREGYNALLDSLQPITPKLVLLSPTFHEDLGPPMKDPTTHNRDLEKYTDAIADTARERKFAFVDLYRPLIKFKRANQSAKLTSNGITLNDAGYRLVAEEIGKQLGVKSRIDKGLAETLRQEIIRANEIFYRRSRPFNDHERHWTYISGDYALYDSELADVEKRITELRKGSFQP